MYSLVCTFNLNELQTKFQYKSGYFVQFLAVFRDLAIYRFSVTLSTLLYHTDKVMCSYSENEL